MRIIRLENATLYKVKKGTKPDGDPTEDYEKIDDYKIAAQYLDDSVSATIYGADVTKTYRLSSIRNLLEKYLLPKNNNTADNISMYLIEYKGNKYRILRVTPKYIDMTWR